MTQHTRSDRDPAPSAGRFEAGATFDEDDPNPGRMTISRLNANPSVPWGFTHAPLPFDDEFGDGDA